MKLRSGLKRLFRVGGIFGATMVLLYAAALISLRVMGFDYAVVISDSMKPVAQRGDLVLIDQSEKAALDHIALFRRGEALVLHRIVKKSDDGWITRGDANPANDPWIVKSDSVVGIGVGVIKGFGTPLLWIGDRFKGGANAAWVNSTNYSYSLQSKWWSVTPTTWTMLTTNTDVSYSQPATITMSGYGIRKVFATTKYFSNAHIKVIIDVNHQDTVSDWIRFFINGCSTSGSNITCGYAITIEKQLKSITLKGIKSNGSLTTTLSSCSFPLSLNFNQPIKLSIKKSNDTMAVSSNNVPCFVKTNLSQSALDAGGAAVTGGYAGVWVEKLLRLTLSPMQIW